MDEPEQDRSAPGIPPLIGCGERHEDDAATMLLDEFACMIVEDSELDSKPSPSTLAAQHGASAMSKVDRVLHYRTDSLLLVLERCTDNQNYLACLRTAELLGVQTVWVVQADRPNIKRLDSCLSKKKARVARQAGQWLDIHVWPSTQSCIEQLHSQGWEIWATDLSKDSTPMDALMVPRPSKLAIVMGREADGVSPAMLRSAHRRVHLPMFGFSGSHNLSVATALVLQQLFHMFPSMRGDMTPARKQQLKVSWCEQLVRREGA